VRSDVLLDIISLFSFFFPFLLSLLSFTLRRINRERYR
jgi:hypothetical protein